MIIRIKSLHSGGDFFMRKVNKKGKSDWLYFSNSQCGFFLPYAENTGILT